MESFPSPIEKEVSFSFCTNSFLEETHLKENFKHNRIFTSSPGISHFNTAIKSRKIETQDSTNKRIKLNSEVFRNKKISDDEDSEKEKLLNNNLMRNNEFLKLEQNLNNDVTCSYDSNFFFNSQSNQIEKFLNNFVDNMSSKENLLENQEASKNILNSLNRNLLLENSLNKSICKIHGILNESDVMKWTDHSVFPEEKKGGMSFHIKKKLLENVNNKDFENCETTGWTQLSKNISNISNESPSFKKSEQIFFGLPLKVKNLFEDYKNIKNLYAWQKECLHLNAVQNHQNLVYSLPTSGGKTLVAELLMLKEVINNKKNVLFILPYVSIIQEKIKSLSQFALDLGFLVEEYAGGKGVIPPRMRRRKNSIYIATIEKALIFINSLIETKRILELGLIVVDELHLLSEEGRGAILETLLTQVLYVTDRIQIIGMTATIGNLSEVAKFLKAESYSGNFRPVRLKEYILCEKKIYEIDFHTEEIFKEKRILQPSSKSTDGIIELVEEVIFTDSILIFCPTKQNCENITLLLARVLSKNLMAKKKEEKQNLSKALQAETNNEICPILKKTLPFGVAYHHSGLTTGERKLLEESFRDGVLSVLCCTSTLAAGVNLPAKRVILRSPYVGRDFITLNKYKQMVGRAGRSDFGVEGESYLICRSVDLERLKKIFRLKMDDITSKLNDFSSCKNIILSAIGLEIATTKQTLKELLSCSLLYIQEKKLNIETKILIDNCVSILHKQGALTVQQNKTNAIDENLPNKLQQSADQVKNSLQISVDSNLTISTLGRAAFKSGLSIEKAHELFNDLKQAQSNLVLLNNLHLLYLVTPPDFINQVKLDFEIYFKAYRQLDSSEIHTATTIGITEFVISKLAMGIYPKNVKEIIINRFYISMMLNELWKQKSLWDVSKFFQLPRGQIQSLMTSSSTYANSVFRFCEEFEDLWCFSSLFNTFVPRLTYCCTAALLPLMDLPTVKKGRAKQLYDAGFKNLHIIANSTAGELVRAVNYMSVKNALQIITAAKLSLTEKAENLREEAEMVLEGIAAEFK